MNGRSDPVRHIKTQGKRCYIVLGLCLLSGNWLGACGAVDSLLRNDPAEPQDRASRFDRFSEELLLGLRDTAPVLERVRLGAEAEDLQGMPWDPERRLAARQSLLWNSLLRVTTEFAPARFQARRAARARIIEQDLRRALGLSDEETVAGRTAPDLPSAPSLLETLAATPWQGTLIESPSVFLREHPRSSGADVESWSVSIQALLEPGGRVDEPAAAIASRAFYGRPLFILALVIEDVMRIRASAGAGGPQDPWFGPLAEATGALPGPAAAEAAPTTSARRRLRKEVEGEVVGLAEVLLEVRSRINRSGVRPPERGLPRDPVGTAADEPPGARRVTAPHSPWMQSLRDAAGRDVDPASLDDLARYEIDRLTRALGILLVLEAGQKDLIPATQTRLDEIRERKLDPPGSTEPKRSPENLWDALEPRLDELVSEPPPIALRAHQARTFERPHGRWAPFVRGNLTPLNDPRVRPSVFLTARERDPISPDWVSEAEALRYGIPGRALVDGFRRAARGETSAYLLLAREREAFEEGWGLYAVAEAARLGLVTEVDLGFGRITQELVAMVALSADIGVHSTGWTREQTVEFILSATPLPGSAARDLVARIFSHPGRAALPAIGLLRFRNLRRSFETFLGADFNAPEFHSALLRGGPIPMAELDTRIEAWINERSPKDA